MQQVKGKIFQSKHAGNSLRQQPRFLTVPQCGRQGSSSCSSSCTFLSHARCLVLTSMYLIVLWVKEQLQIGICTKWTDSHDSSAWWCIGPASYLTVSTQCKKRFACPAFLKPSWMQLDSSNHLGWERPSQSPSPTTNMIYWVHGAILIAGSRTRRLAARNSPPNKFLQRHLTFLHCGKVPFKRIECFLPTHKFMVNANTQLILPKLPQLALPSTEFTLAICPPEYGTALSTQKLLQLFF